MRILENFSSLSVAIPKAARVLQGLDGIETFHKNYGVRHPFASYNVSLSSVARRILTVLEILADTQQGTASLKTEDSSGNLPLLEATDHMLDSLMEHMDDNGGIIRSFFPSSEENRFKSIYTDYKRSVEPYKKHIGSIVNYIKHNQGRLRSISFIWSGGYSFGYFVEGPLSSGGLGPVAEIHPTESTAFSFNRDIPFHLCNIFMVGARLATALHSIDKKIVAVAQTKSIEATDSDLSKVLRLAGELPYVYFPDELRKSVPLIRIKGDGVLIKYPALKHRLQAPPAGSRISVAFRGDGVTSTFRMPYA